MNNDRKTILATFCFESITATITQTKVHSRVGPHVDRVLETWGNDPEALSDMIEAAEQVRSMLHDAFQMVEMIIDDQGPSVEMLLERDVLNAINAQLTSTVLAKLGVVMGEMEPGPDVEVLGRMGDELAASRHMASIESVAGKDYYVPVIKALAGKLGIELEEEEAL